MAKITNEKPEPQPLEIDDDEAIDVFTNYELDDPLRIENPDPEMRYFFAADDGDKSRPDGVARVTAMGYRVSRKTHYSPDCVLMEIPRARWEKAQARKRRIIEDQRKPGNSEFERLAGDSVVTLDKEGGYRS